MHLSFNLVISTTARICLFAFFHLAVLLFLILVESSIPETQVGEQPAELQLQLLAAPLILVKKYQK